MISKKRFSHPASLITLGLIIIFIISACSAQAKQVTETPGAAAGQEDSDFDAQTPPRTCPTEKTLYNLWFSHLAVIDIDAGGGETIYLKFENIPPSYFQLWINPSGKISTESFINITKISYQGTATYPDDGICPVQVFDGIWEMKAEISGVCEKGIVRLHIVEEWINPALHSSCGDWASPPGLYSAPELNLTFDLSSDFPADGITIPEGGMFHASYNYHLVPEGYEIQLVPLVPKQ
jgi:hypothetical protein